MSLKSENAKILLLQQIVEYLVNPHISGEVVVAKAKQCLDFDMKKQYDELIQYAAKVKKNSEAAFLYVSNEITKPDPDIEFLKQHSQREDANPCCLVLLAQLMESNDFGLDFDIDAASNFLTKAIDLAQKSVNEQPNRKDLKLVLIRARFEKIRYILDFKVDTEVGVLAWQSASEKLKQLKHTDQQLKSLGATDEDLLDIKTLRGRVCDAAGEKKQALDNFRRALTLAKKTNSPTGFLNARIAALTPDDQEAKELVPNAISWLDDRGEGENDKEMPDLVQRYTKMVESGEIAEQRKKPASTQSRLFEKTTGKRQFDEMAMPITNFFVSLQTQTLQKVDEQVGTSLAKSVGAMTEEEWNLLPPLSANDVAQTTSSINLQQITQMPILSSTPPPMFTLGPSLFSPNRKRSFQQMVFQN